MERRGEARGQETGGWLPARKALGAREVTRCDGVLGFAGLGWFTGTHFLSSWTLDLLGLEAKLGLTFCGPIHSGSERKPCARFVPTLCRIPFGRIPNMLLTRRHATQCQSKTSVSRQENRERLLRHGMEGPG